MIWPDAVTRSWAIVAFVAITAALVMVWVPRRTRWWMYPCGAALVFALAADLIDWRGLLALLAFGAICLAARRRWPGPVAVALHVVVLVACAALFLHVVPGFQNPRVIAGAVLGPGSLPYTKYLNFDKAVAALFLLGLYVPDRPATDEGLRHGRAFVWRFVVVTTIAMMVAILVGYVRWDPKLPSWWPMWTWSMVFLTALPEEALFRGVVQTSIAAWLGRGRSATMIAIIAAGVLFGVAHLAGGPPYVLLAAVAGIGYGWIYASTRSIGASIAAHAGLNTIHFLLFSYPALRVPGIAALFRPT